MSHLEPERDQLDRIARHSLYGTGANAEMIRYCFRLLKRHFVPGSLLELGPAEGVMTELIQTLTDDITLVDGSEQFCASLRQRFPSADVVQASHAAAPATRHRPYRPLHRGRARRCRCRGQTPTETVQGSILANFPVCRRVHALPSY